MSGPVDGGAQAANLPHARFLASIEHIYYRVMETGRALMGELPARLAAEMAEVATAWLDSLTPAQRAAAVAAGPGAGDEDRTRWFYTPTWHGGLALSAQSPAHQQGCLRLLCSGLSEAAFNTVMAVLGLENVLDRLEGWTQDWGRERGRDPGLYWIRVFGDPAAATWGWRFAGHHVSVNTLVVDGLVVATTPCFIGADPARAPLLGGGVLEPLGATERLARTLACSLSGGQLDRALLHPMAPSDIVSGNRPTVRPGDEMLHMNDPALWSGTIDEPKLREHAERINERAEGATGYGTVDHARLALAERSGLAGRSLTVDQRAVLAELVHAFEGRSPLVTAPRSADSIDDTWFAWAGSLEIGRPHYFRLTAGDLLVEYDNTQRGANHAHSVWRDPRSDFGLDLLARHRASRHR
jgi:hypothetical protein